jgi:hypothetical protein
MGRAKKRGTMEERIEWAQARNHELSHAIKSGSPSHLFEIAHGTQQLATKLTAAGALPIPISKDFYASTNH